MGKPDGILLIQFVQLGAAMGRHLAALRNRLTAATGAAGTEAGAGAETVTGFAAGCCASGDTRSFFSAFPAPIALPNSQKIAVSRIRTAKTTVSPIRIVKPAVLKISPASAAAVSAVIAAFKSIRPYSLSPNA